MTFGWLGIALALFSTVGAVLPFRPYHLAQRVAQRVSVRVLVLLTVAVTGIACLAYPGAGSDVFDYAGFERMWVVYGDNPLFALPIQRPYDWATPFVWFADRTPAYGPLWAVLTWPIVRLAGDSPAAIVLGYKLLSIGAFVACCWFIWRLVEPARRQQSLVLFAWSPLVLFEILGKVHNDILPTLAILSGVWLCTRQPVAQRLSLAGVVAGALIKVTSLAAAPPVLMYLWRRHGWRAVLPATALALAVVAACYVPFWHGPQTFSSIWNQTSRQSWSPASLLTIAADAWLPGGPYNLMVRGLLALVCAGVGAYLVFGKPTRGVAEIASASGWLTLTAVLLLTGVVLGQYLVPAVALAAVSNDTSLRRAVTWLSVGALASYNIDALALTFSRNWLQSPSYQVLGSLVLLGPVTVMLAVRPFKRAN